MLPRATIFHCWQKVGTVASMDRELIGRHYKCLQDLQQATTISVASMITFDTEDITEQISVSDPGVAESAEALLKFK